MGGKFFFSLAVLKSCPCMPEGQFQKKCIFIWNGCFPTCFNFNGDRLEIITFNLVDRANYLANSYFFKCYCKVFLTQFPLFLSTIGKSIENNFFQHVKSINMKYLP